MTNVAKPFEIEGVKATLVQADITTDTTWRIQDSPIIVTKHIVVDANATLTIEPGVEVRFDWGSILVDGSLYAVGTDSSRIRFTSNSINPNPGDWYTIESIGDEKEFFIIENSIVEYAEIGIENTGKCEIRISRSKFYNNKIGIGLTTGNILIEKNRFESNDVGIKYVYQEYYPKLANVTISENCILNNNRGIYIGANYPANFTIINNEIGWSCAEGIYIKGYEISGNLLIQGNYIHSNNAENCDFPLASGIGIYLDLDCYGLNLSIRDNIIMDNEIWGIKAYIDYPDEALIVNNSISSNGCQAFDMALGGGIKCVYVPSCAPLNILNNRIESNNDGIRLISYHEAPTSYDVYISNNSIAYNGISICLDHMYGHYGRIAVTYNSIYHNRKGLVLNSKSFDNFVQYNDFFENIDGIVVFQKSGVNAENNYWGHSSGPFHASLNPTGQGDSVSGNETNLDIIPFLTQKVNPIIPEFPSALILSLFMIATLLAVIIYERKRQSE